MLGKGSNSPGMLGSSPAVTMPSYPHRPPRVDPDLYQCAMPDMVGSRRKRKTSPDDDLRGKQTHIQHGLIWTPHRISEGEVHDFVSFARALTQQKQRTAPVGPNWDKAASDGSLPLESDEQILAYLHKHDYNLVLAKFCLTSESGFGKDADWYRHNHGLQNLSFIC